jgi:hypothetical protein
MTMKHLELDFPTLAFVVGTRAMLGVGIGLLLAGKLPPAKRRSTGLMLVTAGALTTIPAALAVLRSGPRPTAQAQIA